MASTRDCTVSPPAAAKITASPLIAAALVIVPPVEAMSTTPCDAVIGVLLTMSPPARRLTLLSRDSIPLLLSVSPLAAINSMSPAANRSPVFTTSAPENRKLPSTTNTPWLDKLPADSKSKLSLLLAINSPPPASPIVKSPPARITITSDAKSVAPLPGPWSLTPIVKSPAVCIDCCVTSTVPAMSDSSLPTIISSEPSFASTRPRSPCKEAPLLLWRVRWDTPSPVTPAPVRVSDDSPKSLASDSMVMPPISSRFGAAIVCEESSIAN